MNLSFDTARITENEAHGTVTVQFMRSGSFLVGEQVFGNSGAGWRAAFRFCRERSLRVLSCIVR